ncbi:hypothetical protein QJS04_geneDACA005389 [Acorus gramineus]|uniref:Cyclin-like domain-containing protein n=1 Tax=Acorus gramineus TaxID=55184 RepID=A0AAV9AX60_ACOGR|nr:hypothetical protein QJS04_geneDACA005389 [Acorus gramineus]
MEGTGEKNADTSRAQPMWKVKCPYCPSTTGRCSSSSLSAPIGGGLRRCVTECSTCERVIEERQTQVHQLFHFIATDNPLPLVTPDLPLQPTPSKADDEHDDDPFEPTGFITAFSTWSIDPAPVFAVSASSFSGHLAELERALDAANAPASSDGGGPMVAVDNVRAYVQIVDVASILGLDRDIADHAFQLFRDCSSTTCLRNRSIEALATAALVQAIREAQEPRTLQEISTAANLPQKEIGKYIKILGEALQLSQPINSNSIAVHMPRFCTLLQLKKSAQELATHIGEVVINKCFCTRRNPISISAAAIYLACQLEDKRKTQAEICKVTGLTEVTLRKVYKELLENWDDLLPANYTPAIPPEKAFPMTVITSGRSPSTKFETLEMHPPPGIHHDKTRQSQILYGTASLRPQVEKSRKIDHGMDKNDTQGSASDLKQIIDRDVKTGCSAQRMGQNPDLSSSSRKSDTWPVHGRFAHPPHPPQPPIVAGSASRVQVSARAKKGEKVEPQMDCDKR